MYKILMLVIDALPTAPRKTHRTSSEFSTMLIIRGSIIISGMYEEWEKRKGRKVARGREKVGYVCRLCFLRVREMRVPFRLLFSICAQGKKTTVLCLSGRRALPEEIRRFL